MPKQQRRKRARLKDLKKMIENEPYVKRARRRGGGTPYTNSLAVKTRPALKHIFQALGEVLDTNDTETFEKAVRALLVQEGLEELLAQYKRAIEGEGVEA